MIEVTFACNHVAKLVTTTGAVPICQDCGERRIEHVSTPAPRIVGVATGPHVTTENLGPLPVNLGVPLKES